MTSRPPLFYLLILFPSIVPGMVYSQDQTISPEPLSYLNVPLQPKSVSQQSASGQPLPANTVPGFNEALVRMGGSLAVVLSIFLAVVWFTRNRRLKTGPRLGNQTLEIIGQTPLTKNHSLLVVKLGERLLLVSAGETNVTCLSEITDPVEIEQLLQAAPPLNSKRSTFKSLFAQYDQNPDQLFTDV